MNKDLRIRELEAEVERLLAKVANYGRPVKHHVTQGEIFGRITAVQDLGRGIGLFKCFCGELFQCKIFQVKRENRKSCGCSWHPTKPKPVKKEKEKKEVEPNNDPLEILMFHTLW